MQALFDAYGTQGPEAFAFTKAYEVSLRSLDGWTRCELAIADVVHFG